MTEGDEKKKNELIIQSGGAKIKIDPDKLAEALDRIVTDTKIQKDLENKPIETLAELGIEIDDKKRAALTGKKLSEAIAEEAKVALETEKFEDELFAGAPWTMAIAYPRSFNQVTVRNRVFTQNKISPQNYVFTRNRVFTQDRVFSQVGVRAGVSVGVYTPFDEKIQEQLRDATKERKALIKAIKEEEEKAKK